MKKYSSLDVVENSATHASQSAEDQFFAGLDEEVGEVTVERGNVHLKTVNYVYPDGRIVSREYKVITSRRCDSTVNINIK